MKNVALFLAPAINKNNTSKCAKHNESRIRSRSFVSLAPLPSAPADVGAAAEGSVWRFDGSGTAALVFTFLFQSDQMSTAKEDETSTMMTTPSAAADKAPSQPDYMYLNRSCRFPHPTTDAPASIPPRAVRRRRLCRERSARTTHTHARARSRRADPQSRISRGKGWTRAVSDSFSPVFVWW